MATIDITERSFTETLESNEIVFVDFWAAWCGPCRMFARTYDAAAQRHPDITFAKVDTEAEQGLAAAANITSIPTLNATGLEELIQAVKNANIDKLRADAARQSA